MNNFFDEVLVDDIPIGVSDLDETIARMDRLVAVLNAVSKEEDGHKFRGNQYTGGIKGPGKPLEPNRGRLSGILGASRMKVVDRTKPDLPIGADSTVASVPAVAEAKDTSPEAAAIEAMAVPKKIPRAGTLAARKKKYGSTIPAVLESIRKIMPNATVAGFDGVAGTVQQLLPWKFGNSDMVWSVNSLTAAASALDMLAARYPEQAARVTSICGDYLHSEQVAENFYSPEEIDAIFKGGVGLDRLRESGKPQANVAHTAIIESMQRLFNNVPHGQTYAFVAVSEGQRSQDGVLGPQGVEINLAGLMQRQDDADLRDGVTDTSGSNEETLKYFADLAKDSSKVVFATVIHEFGHVMDNMATSGTQEAGLVPGSDGYWENVNIMDRFHRDDALEVPHEIMRKTLPGSYGAGDISEFVAEEFAAHILGERRVEGDFSVTDSQRKAKTFYPWHADVMAYLLGSGSVSKAVAEQQKPRSGIISADAWSTGDGSVATLYVESSDSEED